MQLSELAGLRGPTSKGRERGGDRMREKGGGKGEDGRGGKGRKQGGRGEEGKGGSFLRHDLFARRPCTVDTDWRPPSNSEMAMLFNLQYFA